MLGMPSSTHVNTAEQTSKFQSPEKRAANLFHQLQSPSSEDANKKMLELEKQISQAQKDKDHPTNILRQSTFGVSSEIDIPVQKIQKISSGSIDFSENKENEFSSPSAHQKTPRDYPETQTDRRMDSVFTFHLSEPYTNQSEQEVTFRQIK